MTTLYFSATDFGLSHRTCLGHGMWAEGKGVASQPKPKQLHSIPFSFFTSTVTREKTPQFTWWLAFQPQGRMRVTGAGSSQPPAMPAYVWAITILVLSHWVLRRYYVAFCGNDNWTPVSHPRCGYFFIKTWSYLPYICLSLLTALISAFQALNRHFCVLKLQRNGEKLTNTLVPNSHNCLLLNHLSYLLQTILNIQDYP